MIKKLICLVMIAASVFVAGCAKSDKSDLKIYVISRSAISDSLNDKEIVNAAQKSGRLVFDGEDIKGYNWETHTVTIKNDSIPSLGAVTEESGGSAIFKVDDTYAFVIALNDKLIYIGGFNQGSKNPSVPLQPYISDIDRYSFSILFDSKYATGTDSRLNQTFYAYLNKHGLLSSKSY